MTGSLISRRSSLSGVRCGTTIKIAGLQNGRIIGEINETPDSQRLAIYDKLHGKILAGLKE
jgi:hypothetical protein